MKNQGSWSVMPALPPLSPLSKAISEETAPWVSSICTWAYINLIHEESMFLVSDARPPTLVSSKQSHK